MHLKSVTVSIVSHGQLELILPVLEQLSLLSGPLIDKVVLTINVPEPDLLTGLTWTFALKRIDNVKPKGFGANHNAAFEHCVRPWFLVLNPDMRFDSDVLDPLIVQAKPDSGMLLPRILESGNITPEQHRAIITPLEIFTRRCKWYAQPTAPEWVPGLFMLFRSEAYMQVNGFDQRFFMYGEDFDICARTQLAGWKIQTAENLFARHNAQRASHASPKHLYWHVSSLLKVWQSNVFWRYRKWRSAHG